MSEHNGAQDAAGLQDEVFVELKGPDPEVWGNDGDRPTAATGEDGPGINEIWFEGTSSEIKGPGPEWERDDQGNYINR